MSLKAKLFWIAVGIVNMIVAPVGWSLGFEALQPMLPSSDAITQGLALSCCAGATIQFLAGIMMIGIVVDG